ncbi:MAG: tRNA lysidine(34) synthetase TilS [Phycisphaerales bacterium]|jgi:tRNA(Ile)-lysidine synthase|nr:tRNA lysidine(34) synthetase TilS [Phycisphaerales bacterium]
MASKKAQFETRLLETLKAAPLPVCGARILVGTSGGKDSMVLLDCLAAMAPAREWSLVVAHLDHGLRDESAADAAWVVSMADHFRLNSMMRRVDVAAMAERLGEGVEHAAREARMTFFREAAQDAGASAVVLAHHGDDQAETVLFRIARGTSLRGLAGMAPTRELAEGVTLYRPMLGARREWIDAYAQRHDLSWREDASNTDTTLRRNAIRHEILPAIEASVAPGASDALVRLATQAAEVSELLAEQSAQLRTEALVLQRPDRVILDVKRMLTASAIVRRELVRALLAEMGMGLRDLSDRHLRDVDELLSAPRGNVNLPERFLAKREADLLLLVSPNAT